MAQEKNRLPENLQGPFFVDSSCINCGTCWQLDPKHFAPAKNNSFVHQQPQGGKEKRLAILAMQDCPVGAIGGPNQHSNLTLETDFPLPVTKHPAGNIYYCGWSAKSSFGASSWLILSPSHKANVMIDSPRWSAPLARRIKGMGGIQTMLLTHRDDVADHAHWAKALGCKRWIHKNDSDAAPTVENLVIGSAAGIRIRESLQLIPTPGHTEGSMVVLLGEHRQILFSGDHLWWNNQKQEIVASKKYCWWNWQEQIKSMHKLMGLDIAWLLPGHGNAHHFQSGEWSKALKKTIRHC